MCRGSVHLYTDLKNFKCGSLKTKEKFSFFGLTLTSNNVNWKRDKLILYLTGTLKKKMLVLINFNNINNRSFKSCNSIFYNSQLHLVWWNKTKSTFFLSLIFRLPLFSVCLSISTSPLHHPPFWPTRLLLLSFFAQIVTPHPQQILKGDEIYKRCLGEDKINKDCSQVNSGTTKKTTTKSEK